MFSRALRLSVAGLALAASFAASGATTGATPVLRPQLEAFIEEMAQKHGHEPAWLRKLLGQAQVRASILRAMATPGTARPWHEFRRRNVDPGRIDGGVRFWSENRALLERASREFGVPEEIIVATIGIETMYGRMTGSFRVLDALATLAFDYPPRAEFFRGELEQYLLLARESGLDAAGTRGSFAGAIGIPQFLPSSYRKYAVDFDGDGKRDLVGSVADAIGSVANYYRAFGWRPGASIVVAVDSGEADIGSLLAAGIKPHTRIGELKSRGLIVQEAVDDTAEAALISIETDAGPRLMLALDNFYVITRYNRSINYAMAVHELALAIRAALRR